MTWQDSLYSLIYRRASPPFYKNLKFSVHTNGVFGSLSSVHSTLHSSYKRYRDNALIICHSLASACACLKYVTLKFLPQNNYLIILRQYIGNYKKTFVLKLFCPSDRLRSLFRATAQIAANENNVRPIVLHTPFFYFLNALVLSNISPLVALLRSVLRLVRCTL